MQNKLNILLICKLFDHTLEENVLQPLLATNHIGMIYVLRDHCAPFQDEHVEYVSRDANSRNKLRHLGRFMDGIKTCRNNKIDVIIGVLDIPHGFIGRTIGLLTHTPYIHMTIAGHREFWSNGAFAERIKLLYFGSGAAITVSGNVTRNYLINKGIDPNKLFILPNLPNEAFTKVATKTNKQYDIVSFSRIDANKNVQLFIKALAMLRDRGYTPKVAIAGSGDNLDDVKALAKQLHVDHMINFLGFVSGFDNKVELLTDSKIFISCSKGEGFPVSLIEAMNCGCVPVVTNVGDISDVVKNGVNGYIFDNFEQPEDFANYLEDLLANPSHIEKYSAESLKIKEMISVAENGKVWESVFQSIPSLV